MKLLLCCSKVLITAQDFLMSFSQFNIFPLDIGTDNRPGAGASSVDACLVYWTPGRNGSY